MNTGLKIEREKDTVKKMINIYCRGTHKKDVNSCEECNNLLIYAHKRLSYCQFGEEKTTCEKCSVHCYKPDKKMEIAKVMRYAGPRMILHHPIRAVQHAIKNMR